MAQDLHYRILLAGNNALVVGSVTNALQSLGLDIVVVPTAEALRRRALGEPWSLIISTFASPFVGPYGRLVGQMRRRGLRTPIFLLSPIDDVRVVAEVLCRGVSQYMLYPVSPLRLRHKVVAELRRLPPYHLHLQSLVIGSYGASARSERYS